jgi:hypothetical protein
MDVSELDLGATSVSIVYIESELSMIVALDDGRLMSVECPVVQKHMKVGSKGLLLKADDQTIYFLGGPGHEK